MWKYSVFQPDSGKARRLEGQGSLERMSGKFHITRLTICDGHSLVLSVRLRNSTGETVSIHATTPDEAHFGRVAKVFWCPVAGMLTV